MTAKLFNFHAAQQAKAKQDGQRQPVAVEFQKDDQSDIYCPEMGEVRNPTKLIFGKFIRDCGRIQWAEEDDKTVRELFKKLKIRPQLRKGTECIEFQNNNNYSRSSPFSTPRYKCWVTMKAYGKLESAGVMSTESFLD